MLIAEDVATSTDAPTRMDRFAGWMIAGPLAVTLLVMCVAQLALWVPHYLTWPWWADHDVFATMAHAWSRGELPYRDLKGNNFPGTIYLFWIAGELFGWDRTAPFYAMDVALIGALALVLVAWSRRRFSRFLPGIAAFAAVLTYYLGLDHALTAQRDWHAAVLAAIAILIVQGWPGRAGRAMSAVAFALALVIRPQPVLLAPAALLAIALADGQTRMHRVQSVLEWGTIVGAVLAILFVPLIVSGVFDDFLTSLRAVTYGGHYNKVSIKSFVGEWARQLTTRDALMLTSIGLLARHVGARDRKTALVWAAAWVCASLYRPISPLQHGYLSHPLELITAINLAVLVQFVLEMPGSNDLVRLVAVLLAMGLSVVVRPTMVNPRLAIDAVGLLRRGELPPPDDIPAGYRPSRAAALAALYPWEDYRALLEYVRTHTSRETRIGNALMGLPALTGPTGRLSAFPAESVAWLLMVNPKDEPAFAESLERAEDSIVVWAPSELGYHANVMLHFDLEQIGPVIRRRYEPEAKFGVIEVWRRKGHRQGFVQTTAREARRSN
jgi:hypothetical protein